MHNCTKIKGENATDRRSIRCELELHPRFNILYVTVDIITKKNIFTNNFPSIE